MSRTALLVLADGRFPAGGHAHSGGMEAAVASGRVHDIASLEAFCRGRLHTTGLVAAGLAAAAAHGYDALALDEAADTRTPAPALRRIARRLGRQLMRAARATWPSTDLDHLAHHRPHGAHQPVVLGVTARAARLTPLDAAQAAAYESVGGPATAAVRLLQSGPVRRDRRPGAARRRTRHRRRQRDRRGGADGDGGGRRPARRLGTPAGHHR
ncbi:Urease accessory protein UreF [Streptomyces griseoloalbus]